MQLNDHLRYLPQDRYRAAQGKNEDCRSSCEFVRGGAPRSESVIQMLAGGKHTNANRLAAKRSFIHITDEFQQGAAVLSGLLCHPAEAESVFRIP